MSVIEEKCRDCKFVRPFDPPSEQFRLCHRYPPVPTVGADGRGGFMWASTEASEWCGEWRPKETQ